jgi:hypothetical protein
LASSDELWHHEIVSNLARKLSCFMLFLFRIDLWPAIVEGTKSEAKGSGEPAAKIAQNFFSYGKQSLEALCFYSGAFFFIHLHNTHPQTFSSLATLKTLLKFLTFHYGRVRVAKPLRVKREYCLTRNPIYHHLL